MNNNLASKVLCVGLKTSCFGTSLVDATVTKEILDKHNAAEGSMKATKTRLKEAIEPFAKLRSEARVYFRKQTLPGISDDLRLIPSSRLPSIRAKIDEFKVRDAALLAELIPNYPTAIERDKVRLGGTIEEGGRFDPDLYPPVEQLATQFSISLIVCDLPSGDYHRIAGLDEEAKAQMQKEHEAMLTQVGVQARAEVMKRLTGLIETVAEKMALPDLKGCKESTFDKLREYLDEVPELNVTGDPIVEALRKEAADKLDYSMKIVRDSDILKEQAAQAAKSILAKFGAMGSGRKLVA